MSRPRPRHAQRAQVVIIFPVAALMLLGMAAMAIDGGRLFLGRQELQKAAEAAALDGAIAVALKYPNDPDPASHDTDVVAAANLSLARNLGIAATICQSSPMPPIVKYQGEAVPSTDANGVIVRTTNVNGVYVHLSCMAQFTAAAIIQGVLSLSLAADAVAVLGSNDSGQFVAYSPTLPPYPRVLPAP